MPPKKKQSVLDLSKSRRHVKQPRKAKTVDDGAVGKIGGSQTSIQCNPLQIHQEGLDEADRLLRAFDLNYAYGPCVGMKRIDRWERAESLGLNPPQEIRKILINDKSNKHADSVFSQYKMI